MWNMVYDTSWMLMKDLDVSCVQRAGPYFHFFPTAVFFFQEAEFTIPNQN